MISNFDAAFMYLFQGNVSETSITLLQVNHSKFLKV